MKTTNKIKIMLVTFLFCTFSVYSEQSNQSSESSAKVHAESARVIYLEPNTGKLTAKRPAGVQPLQLSQEELNAMSKSSEGLKQERMPNGGYKMDLQGRFQNFSAVSLDKNGNFKHHCISGDGIEHSHSKEELKGEKK